MTGLNGQKVIEAPSGWCAGVIYYSIQRFRFTGWFLGHTPGRALTAGNVKRLTGYAHCMQGRF